MISNVTRENLLVAKGNYGLPTLNTPLYQTDGSISLMPGQLGIFSSKTHKALNAENVAAQDNIYIAIGMDMDGDGVSDQIRKVAGENLNKRQISKVSAEPPRGACPEIQDFMFDCTDCGTDYGIKIQVDSTDLHLYAAPYQLFTYPVNIITDPCDDCTEDCTPTAHACEEIVCKLIDQINRKSLYADGSTKTNLVPNNFPFEVERLYANITSFTLPCVEDTCGKGFICAIGTIVLDNDGTPVTITVPAAYSNVDGYMLIGQVKLFENAINVLLAAANVPGKFHVEQKCTDSCYTVSLNSCATIESATLSVAALANDSCPDTITMNPAETPLVVNTLVNCANCSDADTSTKTYTCGIRVISKLPARECGCFPPLEYNASNFSKISVFPTSGFKAGQWASNYVQSVKMAEGQGVDLRWREYKQQPGGIGRNYDMYNTTYGRWSAQGFRVKNSVTAECVPYCQYILQHFNTTNSATIAAISTTWNAQFLSTVAIPEKDTATQTAFENVINPWLIAAGIIGAGGVITCSVDKDQTLVPSGYEHI